MDIEKPLSKQQCHDVIDYFAEAGITVWKMCNQFHCGAGFLIEWKSPKGDRCWIDNQGREPGLYRIQGDDLTLLRVIGLPLDQCLPMDGATAKMLDSAKRP